MRTAYEDEKRTIESADLERALIGAASAAGIYLRAHAFGQGQLEWKHQDDPVTTCDKQAERIIKEHLERHAPGNYLGEEHGLEDHGRPRTYLIDPIDGTKSWILKDFLCAVSIGVEEEGKLTGGVVYDFMRDIMYVGCSDERYVLYSGTRHELAAKQPLSKLRLSIEDLPALHAVAREKGYSTHEKSGSIALSMAELAAGHYDGMIRKSNGRGNVWDVAAGDYLLDPQRFIKLELGGKPFDHKTSRSGMLLLRREIADKVLADFKDELARYSSA